jgi:hypothetical protein
VNYTLLFVITRLTCDNIVGAECWVNELGTGELNAITLDHSSCCTDSEVGRVCNAVCSLEKILRGEHRALLERVLIEDTIMVIVSPFSQYFPHGVWLVGDIPQCVFEIWINRSHLEDAEEILKSKLTQLVKFFLEERSLFIPELPYFLLFTKLDFQRARPIRLNNSEWLYFDFKDMNTKECVEWFREKCSEERDEACLRVLGEVAT